MKFIISSIFLFLSSLNVSSQDLISFNNLGAIDKDSISNFLGQEAENGVERYKVVYSMIDHHGNLDTASGLVCIPIIVADDFPVVAYQHPTVNDRNDVPSRLNGGYQESLAYSGSGFITSSADYVGLGDSDGFHLYAHRESEALAGVYMLKAAKSLCDQLGYSWNEFLFISGYSQGGHAAMSMHQLLQESWQSEFNVTAATPMSGPYSLSEVFRDVILSDDSYNAVGFVPYAILSYQTAYGTLFEELEEYFQAPYLTTLELFWAGQIDLTTFTIGIGIPLLNLHGALVPKYMFQDSIVEALSHQPDHPLNVVLRDNDTYNWRSDAPMELYYCDADAEVSYLNSLVAESKLTNNGSESVTAVQIDPNLEHVACATPSIMQSIIYFKGFLEDVPVDDLDLSSSIKIYPNPTSGEIQIEGVEPEATYQVYDMQGRLLQTSKLSSSNLDLRNLQGGNYYLRILSDKENFTHKIQLLR